MKAEFAKGHLDLILSFFPRVESQIALLLGVNVAMIGYLGSKLPPPSRWRSMEPWIAIVLTIAAIAFLAIFIALYRAAFPSLEGGQRSLVYFREIATRTESGFLSEYRALEDDAFLRDLAGQIWRNSEILRAKYDRVKLAYQAFAVALPAWVASVALLSS